MRNLRVHPLRARGVGTADDDQRARVVQRTGERGAEARRAGQLLVITKETPEPPVRRGIVRDADGEPVADAWVRLDVNERNVGFSAGCNQGAALAERAEVLVFLNNDMRVERDWLRRLVEPVTRGACQAATAKMFSWDGKRIDSAVLRPGDRIQVGSADLKVELTYSEQDLLDQIYVCTRCQREISLMTFAEGEYSYEVPSWVPKGTGGLEVTATHTQRGQTCIVAVTMSVEGDPGPAAIIGAAGSAMFAAGVIGAGFKRKVA